MDEEEVTPPNSDHRQLGSRVRDAMAKHDLSQVDVAQQIDVSSTTISRFLSGRYKGDNEKVASKLAVWLETLASGRKVPSTLDRIDIFTDAPPTTRRILKAELSPIFSDGLKDQAAAGWT